MSLGMFGLAFFAMIGMMLVGIPIAVSMALVGIVGGMAAYGVPFMDMTLNHLLHSQTQNHNGKAGEALRWQVPEAESGRAYAIWHPDGRRVRLASRASTRFPFRTSVHSRSLYGRYHLCALRRHEAWF